MAEIVLRCRLRDVVASRPERIFSSASSQWWTHEERLLPTPSAVDLGRANEWRGEDFLQGARWDPSRYGRHGLLAFEAAHILNCVDSLETMRPACLPSWDDYNDALDRCLRRPSFEGRGSKAWILEERQDHATRCPANVATVLVHQPSVHVAWEWWQLSVVHLRPLLGVPRAARENPSSSHEIVFFAIDPSGPVPDPADRTRPWRFLNPADLAVQVRHLRDLEARQILLMCAQKIGMGEGAADADYRSFWTTVITRMAGELSHPDRRRRFFDTTCPSCGASFDGGSPRYLRGNPLCCDPVGCWRWRQEEEDVVDREPEESRT